VSPSGHALRPIYNFKSSPCFEAMGRLDLVQKRASQSSQR
jgi:hypothetical protein